MDSLFLIALATTGILATLCLINGLALLGLMIRNVIVYGLRKNGYKRFKMISLKNYL